MFREKTVLLGTILLLAQVQLQAASYDLATKEEAKALLNNKELHLFSHESLQKFVSPLQEEMPQEMSIEPSKASEVHHPLLASVQKNLFPEILQTVDPQKVHAFIEQLSYHASQNIPKKN